MEYYLTGEPIYEFSSCRKTMEKAFSFQQSSSQFRLSSMQYVTLGEFWDGLELSGTFWRIYIHDSPGAGVWYKGKKIPLLPGKIYLIAPHSSLRSWCEPLPGERAPGQFYLHFETTLFAGNREKSLQSFPITPEMERLLGFLRSIFSGKQPPVPGSREDAIGRLYATALASLLLTLCPEEALTALESDQRMEEICNYLQNHLEEELHISALADRAGMSRSSFLRAFAAHTGGSPYQYLLHTRYLHAARLLEADFMTIDEISQAVGVRDRFHFSRTFRKLFGSSPGRYRALYRESRENAPENLNSGKSPHKD